ncbi:unnamed protein product [Brassica oleracea var. botrytis]|uniref:(rape) hypothetical protein n=1 Tax=Brassica napus TaxID=3708 RepID=A0A816QJR2_BRANA|nr:unnamed protein product [Brassica napus]
MVYVEIFVTVNCGTGRGGRKHWNFRQKDIYKLLFDDGTQIQQVAHPRGHMN